ncbi:alpha/beta fold hydrolase [Nocardia sp. NPDC059091]|uniref:alpha/beta hydrolase n=1 Tax=Nocardia sp. NPDC059091 TaxID=3346724 RepID=UPI0036C5DDEF
MSTKTAAVQHFTIRHDGVAIPVSRGGRGRPLVLCPGLLTTQADLRELIELLRHDYDVVTFDYRGHGLASAAGRYSFAEFLSDFAAVMTELPRLGLSSVPVLVGHSLGADLVVNYASEFCGTAAGLVLLDGANPVPEPFLTEADLPELRTLWEDFATQQQAVKDSPQQVLLSVQDIVDVNLEVEAFRFEIRQRQRHRERIARLVAGDNLVLPPQVVEFLDQLRAFGVDERIVGVERDGWIPLVTRSPERVAEWVARKQRQLTDPQFLDFYLTLSQALDWADDDPRLAELADRTAVCLTRIADEHGHDYISDIDIEPPLTALLDTLALDTAPPVRRLIGLLAQRGWTGWTKLERVNPKPDAMTTH